MMPGTRPPFQGDSLGDVFPRAEAHGLFCFRPLGDGKMSKLKAPPVWAVFSGALAASRLLSGPGTAVAVPKKSEKTALPSYVQISMLSGIVGGFEEHK